MICYNNRDNHNEYEVLEIGKREKVFPLPKIIILAIIVSLVGGTAIVLNAIVNYIITELRRKIDRDSSFDKSGEGGIIEDSEKLSKDSQLSTEEIVQGRTFCCSYYQ